MNASINPTIHTKHVPDTNQVMIFRELVCTDYFDARDKIIRELQKTRLLTKDIAEISKRTQNTISRLKHGETFEPRGTTLIGVAKALNIRLVFEP